MKTENEYATKLIQQYLDINLVYDMDYTAAIYFAINDVTNTIEALNYAWTNFDNNSMDEIITYHNNVLNILKEKV